MKIKEECIDGITVVALIGRFDAASAPEVEDHFQELISRCPARLLVDLSGVEYISSGGLRVIIMLAKAVGKVKGELRLCALNPFVTEVFQLTNLYKKYLTSKTREDALAAFNSQPSS